MEYTPIKLFGSICVFTLYTVFSFVSIVNTCNIMYGASNICKLGDAECLLAGINIVVLCVGICMAMVLHNTLVAVY
jgi:hypothetical protein